MRGSPVRSGPVPVGARSLRVGVVAQTVMTSRLGVWVVWTMSMGAGHVRVIGTGAMTMGSSHVRVVRHGRVAVGVVRSPSVQHWADRLQGKSRDGVLDIQFCFDA